MATLSNLLSNRVTSSETNLERGRVYMFASGQVLGTLWCGFCWKPPASGTAIIEAWGPAGSGGRMCCCGFGTPGNTGAYGKKTITVNTSCFVCGCLGMSCGNASALNFRGCGSPTVVCWTGCGSNGCFCVQGGAGGYAFCSTGTVPWCCFYANGYCGTCIAPGCGIICNTYSGAWCATAQGSAAGSLDICCAGCFSCLILTNCDVGPINHCYFVKVVPSPPGMGAQCGTNTIVETELGTVANSGNNASSGLTNLIGSFLNSKNSLTVSPMFSCWAGYVPCGCYEYNGCVPYSPMGVPGLSSQPCADVRDQGTRGGHGGVKITFIAS